MTEGRRRSTGLSAPSRRLLAALPEDLAFEADLVGNGEPLWLPDAAIAVVNWGRAAEWAITAGEIYRALGHMQTSFVSDWEVPAGDGDPWPAYVRRTAEFALAEVEAAAERVEARELRFFFLAVPPTH